MNNTNSTLPVWHDINKEKPVYTGKDVDLILHVDGLPMQFIAACWDGKYMHIYSGNPDAPWGMLPSGVKILEWAYVPDLRLPRQTAKE